MARREATGRNEILIQDHLSGSELGIYYRQPNTEERQSYINKKQIKVDGEWVDNSVQNRVDHALDIITGLRDGDFERVKGDGYAPISTDRNSKDYYEKWPEWMEDNCGDILALVAVRVFEMPVTIAVVGQQEKSDTDKKKAKKESLEKK